MKKENNSNNNDDDNDGNNNDDDVSESESENENDKDDDYYLIKQLNNHFKSTNQTKSIKEQIEILKTKDFLDQYWHFGYHHGNKELNHRIFKAKAAHILNDVDEQLFEKIFGHTFAALVDKLINTIGEEENKIIIDDIEKNKDKIYKQDECSKFVIHSTHKRGDLLDAIKIILNFNEVLSLDDNNYG